MMKIECYLSTYILYSSIYLYTMYTTELINVVLLLIRRNPYIILFSCSIIDALSNYEHRTSI